MEKKKYWGESFAAKKQGTRFVIRMFGKTDEQ